MAVKIKYEDVEYPSIAALVSEKAAKGITYAAVISRITAGWDLKAALNEPTNKNTQRSFEIDGIIYKNLKELSKAAGISYHAAVKRLHRGWSAREILHGRELKNASGKKGSAKKEHKQRKPRGNPVTVNGKQYENIFRAYEVFSPEASINAVRARLRYGWSVEEALEVVKKIDGRKLNQNRRKGQRKREKKAYVIDGVKYTSVKKLAEAYGLSPALVYNRMHINGWSAKQSVFEPVSNSIVLRGKKYRSAMSAWESEGETSFSVYQARKTSGHKLEVCLGLEPLPKKERYELDSKSYSSLGDVAADYGLNEDQLSSRLRNMSLEEAVNYNPSNGKYSTAYFCKFPDVAQSSGSLYFVSINFEGGQLHKIGITRRPVADRFKAHDYRAIAVYEGQVQHLYKLEQEAISVFKHLHYRADEDFDGRTETFLLTDDEETQVHLFLSGEAGHYSCTEIQAL